MARASGVNVQKNFINGLITERTALQFPEDACTSVLDCEFDRTGRITRRPAFDVEQSSAFTTVTLTSSEAYTEFHWTAVAGDGDISFFVQQQANVIRFYDTATTVTLQPQLEAFTVDLDTLIPIGSALDPAVLPCQYAVGNGDLIIVNPATEPVYVTYNATANTIEVNNITLKYRDFAGLEDGLDIYARPTATFAGLATSNPFHYYNIVNQGWFVTATSTTTDALTQWDAARTDMPSNTDRVAYFRLDSSDAFSNGLVLGTNFFTNTPATKGHFILDVHAPDRVAALTSEAYAELATTVANIEIGRNIGTYATMTNATSEPENAWNNTTTATFNGTARRGTTASIYAGKDYGTSPRVITQAIVYGSSDQGYVNGANPNLTITLRGSNTTPVDFATDGTSLGTATLTDSANESAGTTIASSDTTTKWRYVWLRVARDDVSAAASMGIAELRLFTAVPTGGESLDVDVMSTTARPSTCAFYASRIFYAGIDDVRRGSNIYYSQLIQDRSQYGKCYQANDPTSEEVPDLLATDGGVIKIPEIGTVKKLYTYQTSLIVLASNGVWIIQGGAGSPFTATDIEIRKLSSVTCTSAMSVVDVKGIPMFWGEDGIYNIAFDPSYQTFQVQSITEDRIKSYILDIPDYSRLWVKGTYDAREQKVVWMFNDSAALSSTTRFTYTDVLILNTRTQAFYPWSISVPTDIDVRGLCYVTSADNSDTPIVKYTITKNRSSVDSLGFANCNSVRYTDWDQYATDVADSTQRVDYTSYFETGHYIHGNAQNFFQPNFVFVYMDVADYSSVYMQGIFDFTNSGSSGKYGTLQQCYNDEQSYSLEFRNVSIRRLKVRGKGRSLRIRFESEAEKPFTIIGWSTYESANTTP